MDILGKLRGHPGLNESVTQQFCNMVAQRHEAADEIERLLAVCKDKTVLLHDAYAGNERLTGLLKIAESALDQAECVIDADDCVEVFNAVQTARKMARAALKDTTP